MNNKTWLILTTLLVSLLCTACISVQINLNNQPGGQNSSPSQASTTARSAPAASSGNQHSLPPQTDEERQLSQRLFSEINQNRAAQHLYPYTWNNILAAGARQHSWNMTHCGLSHACPGEPDPCQRVLNEGIHYMACGENVGTATYPTAWAGVQAIDEGMMAEKPPDDGHRKNLLSTDFHQIGIGILVDNTGTVWVTEDFVN